MARVEMLWHKFFASRFIKTMAPHSNDMVGMWMRTWCELSDSGWKRTLPLESWARVIGEDVRITKQFLNYAKKNFSGVEIVTSSAVGTSAEYTITDEWYLKEQEARNYDTSRQKKYRGSQLAESRTNNLQTIIRCYHPKRRVSQLTLARNQFEIIMRDCTRNVAGKDKISMEDALTEEIVRYIKHLESSNEWDKEGKYLPSIGSFLKSRPWEVDQPPMVDSNDPEVMLRKKIAEQEC